MAGTDIEADEAIKSNSRALDAATMKHLIPQAWVGFVDSCAFMIVAPSLVFYVLERGGTKEQYGMILAVFSFSSFLTKPLLGIWSDRLGGKYRSPYLATIILGSLGHLLYFFASLVPPGMPAVAMIFAGRFFAGAGAANQTLGFSYIAQVVDSQKLTQASAVLSMVRVAGMALSPGLNVFLAWMHAKFTLFGYQITIDPLNSVGLLMLAANAATFFTIYWFLEEPPASTKPERDSSAAASDRSWMFWVNILRADILVPALAVFTMNFNWQLLEVSLAPVANDALGWTQVAISTLFGLNSLIIFAIIVLAFRLSSQGVPDVKLMKAGLCFSIVGYALLYVWWVQNVPVWKFILPVILCTMAFPLLGSPTRSVFTVAVAGNEYLRDYQGTMQALLSMIVSVPGFAGPGLVAAYILRTPEEVAASPRHHEFTTWALYAPLLAGVTLLGVYYIEYRYQAQGAIGADVRRSSFTEQEINERLALLGNLTGPGGAPFRFHPRVEANRRHSTIMMGIPDWNVPALEQEVTRATALF